MDASKIVNPLAGYMYVCETCGVLVVESATHVCNGKIVTATEDQIKTAIAESE